MLLLQQKPRIAVVNIKDLFTIVRRFVVIGNTELELLDEKIIYQSGCFKRVRRWFRGAHPSIGVIIRGFTGVETLVEQDVIMPMGKFQVIDNPPNPLI
jgi:hypothetical protein